MSRYLIPKGPARAEIQISNSRFISSVGYAPTVEAARAFIQAVRQEMPEANHHVYAFKVGHGAQVTEGMSDDGEPSGTSGPPTLAVVRGTAVGDLVLVTTRYFGGTKLGTGGLVYAYTNAAKEGLKALQTEWKVLRKLVGVTVPYTLYERLKQLTEKYEGLLEDEEFSGEITRYIRFPLENLVAFEDDMRQLSNGSIVPVVLDDV
ncbi:MAG: YigZ family protein [Anaerolineae bacterium]|nr:YigZ family protein [Anaerolineae bacterium]